MNPRYRFEFLGIFQLSVQQKPEGEWRELDRPATVKAQSLLAYLVMNRKRPSQRETLATMFWENSPDRKARQSLATALWHIRQIFPDNSLIKSDTQTIRINSQADIWLDVDIFDDYLSSSDYEDWQMAVTLYQGDFLQTFYDDWIITQRYTYQARFYEALARLMVVYESNGAFEKARTSAEQLLSHEPLREDAHRLLMRAYNKLGQPERALRQYRRCREVVLAELKVEPMAETTDLYQAILEGRFSHQPAKQTTAGDQFAVEEPVTSNPPYKGLQFFDVADAELFFGRDSVVKQLADQFLISNFLAVVGASGSGKSSVVRAGLIPFLQKNHQYSYHLITPTARPLQVLSSLLDDGNDPAVSPPPNKSSNPKTKRVLVVDQFEELFTLCRDESERHQFLQRLVTAVTSPKSPWKLIIVLRADFYAHCAEFEGLRNLLARHQGYIGPLTTDELRQAIEQPVLQHGWEIAPGLVDLILRDMGNEPGALPLLSHALLETWFRRRGGSLTLDGYSDAGGVFGAIAKTADHVFHELPPDQQRMAQNIFLRLTELGEGTLDTRRRISLNELIPPQAGQDDRGVVLKRLTDARLIVTTAETAEVAHEALIREWPTLRHWLNKNRESLRVHRQLTDASQVWERLEKDEGVLYRGANLSEAQEWFETQPVQLNALEDAFLQASIAFAEKQRAEKDAQHQRDLMAAQQLAETRTQAAKQYRNK
ncbi:MAG: hypothetical protein DWQ04_13500 [Chloroflexi bacterium]|nr:MAG: hypothetical protein DWQ04_13500 [Chloroflexota bacterium]